MDFVHEWGPFIITIMYTVIAVILGYSAKGKLDMKKVENWSKSGNTMGLVIMIFLTGAGNVSAYTFMGAPGWAFSRGIGAFYVVVYLAFMIYTSYIISPRVTALSQKHDLGTLAQSVGVRYESPALRFVCGIVTMIACIGNSIVQIIGCGYILNVMSGNVIPMWLGELVIISAVTFYVYKSGLRAIGWTNVMQGVIMFTLSCLVGVFVITLAVGHFSPAEAFRILAENHPEYLSLPGAGTPFPPIFWTTSVLVSVLSYLPAFWIWSAGAKSPEETRKQYGYLPIFYFVMIPMIVVGLVCIFAFPDFAGEPDKVAITYIIDNLPWWLAGIFGAGVLAASQSSAEPLFHISAYSLAHDIVAPAKKWNETKEGVWQRRFLLVVVFLIAYPLALSNPAELVYIYIVVYGFAGQVFPAVLGTLFWPRATKAGVFSGMIAGLTLVMLFNIVWVNPLGVHAGIWGLALNVTILVIVSLCTTPAKKSTIEIFFPQHIIDNLYEDKSEKKSA